MLFLLATFIMGLGFIQWFHTVPVFIKNEWGFDERYIGFSSFWIFISILVGLSFCSINYWHGKLFYRIEII